MNRMVFCPDECCPFEVVKLLLENGATATIDAADRRGCTPVYTACDEGHLDVAKLLLEKRASVDAVTTNGKTALEMAVVKMQGNSPQKYLPIVGLLSRAPQTARSIAFFDSGSGVKTSGGRGTWIATEPVP